MSFEFAPQKYNGNWPEIFRAEAKKIKKACGTSIVEVEHIGSTAVARLMAKPIIDILVSTKTDSFPKIKKPMEDLGYLSKGENGIAGRSYFSKSGYHVHCFEDGHFEIEKHVAFRNYLRANPEVRDQYNDLKTKILKKSGISRDEYQSSKQELIQKINQQAIQWNKLHPKKTVKKAVVYALRNVRNSLEVLVFDHKETSEVSPQVPSGTISKNEEIVMAAKRELHEESGVESEDLRFLGSYIYYKSHADQFQERFIFAFRNDKLTEKWDHKVTGGGDDQDLIFRYYWLSISEAKNRLKADFGDALEFFQDELVKL